MRYHLFLQYGWLIQNLGKHFIRTNMHTTATKLLLNSKKNSFRGNYSRKYGISSDEVFFNILKKPSIVQKKVMPHMKAFGLFDKMKQKKFQNGRLTKFKMAASKKTHFPAPPILNIFS